MPLQFAPIMLDGLTLKANLCLERGGHAGAAMFIDLIYDLHDWDAGAVDMAACSTDTGR